MSDKKKVCCVFFACLIVLSSCVTSVFGRGEWSVSPSWEVSPSFVSDFDDWFLELDVVAPIATTYTDIVPVGLGLTGNDSNPVITWNMYLPNSTWLYATNKTYFAYTSVSFAENLTDVRFCGRVEGDFCVDYVEVVFDVVCVVYEGGGSGSWLYSRLLNFSSGFEGLQVNFNVSYFGLFGRCQVDFEDLRFVDFGSGVVLDAWNETTTNSNYVEVWLELGAGLEVTMFYGNGLVGSVWDAELVFERVIDSGVVLALPMDEGSGTTVYDYSGYGNNGTVVGADWINDCVFGNGLNFVATNSDRVTIADSNSLDLTSSLSVFVYFRSNGVQADNVRIYDKNRDEAYQLRLMAGNVSRSQNFVGGVSQDKGSTGLFDVGVWNTLGFSFDTVNWTFYVNGVSAGSGVYATTGNLGVNSRTLVVGANYVSAGNFLNGSLGGLYLFNATFVAAEFADFDSFYPQCFVNHLGSLFLREWNGGVMPSVVFGGEVVPDVPPVDLTDVEGWVGFAVVLGFLGLVVGLGGFLLVFVVRRRR